MVAASVAPDNHRVCKTSRVPVDLQPGITIPQNSTSVTINAQGQVSAIVAGSTTPTVLGQITLTRFINKAGLQPIGDNLFVDTPASGTPQDGTPSPSPFPSPQVQGENRGPALKPMATVASEIVRIGDLIENAGVVADVAIFRAPDLGQTGSVSASRVIDAVRPHHIIGLDTRGQHAGGRPTGAFSSFAALENFDGTARLGKAPANAKPDHPATDDGNPLVVPGACHGPAGDRRA